MPLNSAVIVSSNKVINAVHAGTSVPQTNRKLRYRDRVTQTAAASARFANTISPIKVDPKRISDLFPFIIFFAALVYILRATQK